MRTLDIGIDLDGVCYDFAGSLRHYLHHYEGRSMESMPPTTTWHFYSEQWGMTLEQFIEACDRGVDAGVVFRLGDPHPGTQMALDYLKVCGHRLHIITDRSFGSRSQENTIEWLSEHRIPFDTLTFSRDKTLIPVDTFIDDRVENYDALEAFGSNPFLYDRPWNQGHPARRVTSWNEFVDKVDDLRMASA